MTQNDKNVMEKTEALKRLIMRILPEPRVLQTQVCGLTLARLHEPTSPRCSIYNPLALLILQGEKHSILGTRDITYGAGEYMVTNMSVPSSCHVAKASESEPYLALFVPLNADVIADLLRDIRPPKAGSAVHCAVNVARADASLLDAFLRLTALVEKPAEEQKILAPAILREIHYRLLTGPFGNYMMTINTVGSKDNMILKAIEKIKADFDKKINIEELSKEFGMTASTFYRNFMKVSTMSPIQYQKQIRLNEAQRLMLAKKFDAQRAAYAVGYESVTQFSKEYKRRFGLPPLCDVRKIRDAAN